MEDGEKKDLIRIYKYGDDKVGIYCDCQDEEDLQMAVCGLFSLFNQAPEIPKGLSDMVAQERLKENLTLLMNNSKTPS